MDRSPLNFAFSSCPNDTFAFHALVHGLVQGPRVVPHIDDVEALNARAERGDAEVTKISIAAYEPRAATLCAASRGRSRRIWRRAHRRCPDSQQPVGGRVAIPGERTTAALLLRLLGRFERCRCGSTRSNRRLPTDDVDCGVLIHEGRFT